MTVITLPREIEVWAEREVRNGGAESVEALALRVLERERQLSEFRASLDEAEARAEREGAIPVEQAFARVRARLLQGE